MASILFSLALFAVLALTIRAWKRWRSEGASLHMWLMIVAAVVIFANIAIWVVPDNKGQSLVTGEAK